MIMLSDEQTAPAAAPPGSGRVTFTARDITGSHVITADMPGTAPVGDVARTLANRLNLPANVAWSLRNDRGGQYLKDDAELATEIPEKDAKLTLTPRTHLG